MKFLFRIILPFICSTYLALIIGQPLNISLSKYIFIGIIFFWLLNNFLTLFYEKLLFGKKCSKKHLLISALLSILIIVTGGSYLVPSVKPASTSGFFTVTALGIKDPSSSSSEVWIAGITNADHAYDLEGIPLDSGWIRKDHSIVSYKQQPAALKINIIDPLHPAITFIRHDWSGKVKIKGGTQEDIIDLYKEGQREVYKYDIKALTVIPEKEVSMVKPLFFILAFVFFMTASYLGIILVKRDSKYYLLYSILLWTVLFAIPSHLVLSVAERILLLGLSVLTGILFSKAIKAGLLKELNMMSRIILSLIACYTGFACVGNSVFLFGYPGIQKFAFFALCIIWSFAIDVAFLYITDRLKKKALKYSLTHETVSNRFFKIRLWLLFFIIPFSVGSVYLYAFFPGVMSSDSLGQWGQAIGTWELNDWHPVFHTLFNRILITIYKSPASIALGQIVFTAVVVAEFMVFLYRKGVPRPWLLLFVVVFSLMPQNGIYMVTLWKDIPFTVSMLWLTLVLAKTITCRDYLKRPAGGLQLTLALICIALFRHNGGLVFIVTIAALSFYFFREKNKTGFAFITLSVILIAAYNIFLATTPHVIPIPKGIKWMGPIHGIAAIVANDADLPEDVQKKVDNIQPKEIWIHLFSPYSEEDYVFKTNGVFVNKLSDLSTGDILKMYAASFFRHPYLITRDRFQGSDFLWDLTQPVNAYNNRYNTELEANDFGLAQTGNGQIKNILKQYLKFSEDYGSIFIWRIGIYNVFLILLMFFVMAGNRREKQVLLIFEPWLVSILSLASFMVPQEFRYVYYIFVLFFFIWLLVISNAVKASVIPIREMP